MIEELHPAWKVCIGMAIVLFVTFAGASRVLIMQQNAINENADAIVDTKHLLIDIEVRQKAGEERAYIARAISGCSDLINDEEIEVTEECTDPRVAAYYSPSVCEKLPLIVQNCGARAIVVKP